MSVKVSIVTPSFNQAKYLEHTIQSVLGQSYENIEYIVIDGASSDGSVDCIKKYENKIFYWESAPDNGQADAIRKGFDRCSGDILAWLNSDDVLSFDAVELAVSFLDKHPDVDMVYGNRMAIDERGRILYRKRMLPVFADTLFVSMIVGQESCFWRRSAYERVGGVNPQRYFSMDYELFSRIGCSGQIRYCSRLWGGFRIHAHSRTVTEYSSAGRDDVRDVQDVVWKQRPGKLAWQGMSLLIKFWGLTGAMMRYQGSWGDGHISTEVLPLKDRVRGSFHEGSFVRRLMGSCSGR